MFGTVTSIFILSTNDFFTVTKGNKDDPFLFSFCSHQVFNYIYSNVLYQADKINVRSIMHLEYYGISNEDLMLAGSSVTVSTYSKV